MSCACGAVVGDECKPPIDAWDERVIVEGGRHVGTIHETRYQSWRVPMVRFDAEPTPMRALVSVPSVPFADAMTRAGYVMLERRRRDAVS